MKEGIRIYNEKNGTEVELPDILEEIRNGNSLHWSILDFSGIGDLGEGKSIPAFQEQIIKSKNGFFINWDDLNQFAQKMEQIFDIIIIGCTDPNLLKRYDSDQKRYEMNDISIEMFDGGFVEVFTNDRSLINRLAKKFTNIEIIKSDYRNDFYK